MMVESLSLMILSKDFYLFITFSCQTSKLTLPVMGKWIEKYIFGGHIVCFTNNALEVIFEKEDKNRDHEFAFFL